MEFIHTPRSLPLYRRVLALLGVNIYVFVGNMFAAGPATAFSSLAEEFHVPFSELSGLITYPALLLGLANLFWVPTSLCIGKRSAVLVSMVIALAGFIWSCVAPSYEQLLASRILASFGAGSVESIGPSIMADLVAPRYYATAMAFYALFLSGGSQVGPLIAGYISAARGWRWFFITCVIVIAFDIILVFLLLPETLRDADSPPVPETSMEDDGHEKGTAARIEDAGQFEPSAIQPSRDLQYSNYWTGLFRFSISSTVKQDGIFKYWFRIFLQPVLLAWRPAILYSSLTYGIILGGVITVSTLSPQLFSPPPYLFTEIDLGLLSCASFIGIVLTWPIAGPLTDKLALLLDKRTGIHNPRHRLPALIVPFLICPTGVILFGYFVAQHRHYVLPALGSAMLSAGLTLVPSVTMAYVAEVYAESNGQAFVAINALKNIIGFGFSKGCYEWMGRMGVDRMFATIAGIEWAILGLGGVALFLWGATGSGLARRTI